MPLTYLKKITITYTYTTIKTSIYFAKVQNKINMFVRFTIQSCCKQIMKNCIFSKQ